MRVTARNLRYGAAGLVLILAAFIYLLTLDTGLRPEELVGGDLITHQYAQVEARPSNAPGYPLYTMGGWLWFRLVKEVLGWILNPVQILSLYSTLWSLASLLVLYLILMKVTNRQWGIASLLTLFYGFTFFFWYYSVTTEQYTSAVFQTLGVIWLAFKWDERPGRSTLLWLAFLTGTMLANMVTTLFILPPLLWFLFFKRDNHSTENVAPVDRGGGPYFLANFLREPKLILQAVGLALLPLLSYLFIYIRGAQHPEWRGQGTWGSPGEWFIQFLTIQQGRDELAPGLTLQNFFTAEFPALMWQELTWPIFLGGLVGLAFLGWRRAIFLYSTLLIYFFFSWGYRFGNWFQVVIPAYPIFVLGFAAAVGRLGAGRTSQRGSERSTNESKVATTGRSGERIRSATGRQSSWKGWNLGRLGIAPWLVVVVGLFLTGLVLYRVVTNFPEANQRYQPEDTGLDPGWLIVADQPRTPAIISGTFEERVALQYLETVWGALSEIFPTDAGDFEPGPTVDLDAVQTYVTRQAAPMVPELVRLQDLFPQAAGAHLIALEAEAPAALPATATPLWLNFGNQLQLVGWELVSTDMVLPPAVARRIPQPDWQLALYWQALSPPAADYTISVRPLVGGTPVVVEGEALIQDHQPVWGLYPTSRWRAGELIRDVYALAWPDGLPNPDAVQILVYQPTAAGFKNLAEQIVPLTSDPTEN